MLCICFNFCSYDFELFYLTEVNFLESDTRYEILLYFYFLIPVLFSDVDFVIAKYYYAFSYDGYNSTRELIETVLDTAASET